MNLPRHIALAALVPFAGCAPSPEPSPAPPLPEPAPIAASAPEGMALIPGGAYRMGSDAGHVHEQPVHEAIVDPFYLDIHEVTNGQFAAFVAATGHVTEAEKWGWSLVFTQDDREVERVPEAPWWVKVDKADWRHPNGPESSIEGKDDLPVIQVSWNDAQAYCAWAGKRLPTEAEWEFAARGGLAGTDFPWTGEFAPDGIYRANTWNGTFPDEDSGADGHRAVAPVMSYPPNAYGLFDMAGNVWEWCSDWYASGYYAQSPAQNPAGPASGVERIQRGGSWMCSDNYCKGYRVFHRSHCAPDTGLTNAGFRCAQSVVAPR